MNVLHVHSGNLYGGVETSMVTLVRQRHYCPAMEQFFALCFEGRLSAELKAAGASVHWLGETRVSRPLSVWKARRELSELLRRQPFDVAVCHSAWSQALFGPVAHASGLPLIFWLHGAVNRPHWLEQWARHTAPDLVICNSCFTASTLKNLYPHTPYEVVYPMVSWQANITSGERARMRAALQTDEHATVIVQVSRLEAWKGHAMHLQALSLLRELPGWVCWQVGGAQRPREARYLNEMKKLAADLGLAERVRFLGERTDVPQLLAAADIHCQPNIRPEPFGQTFVEALMAQLPVVTTAFGGAREIVDDSCGCLVPPDDPQSLAMALRRLMTDHGLCKRLGAAGPARAQQLCDVGRQVRRLKNVCDAAVQRQAA